MKKNIACLLILFSSIISLSFGAFTKSKLNVAKFDKPFCMIGNGNPKQKFKKKLHTLRRYQRKISRRPSSFRRNKRKEVKLNLHGSPKWVALKYLEHKGYSRTEVDFVFFAMTLFAEARNLSKRDMTMVARVINNRRKGRSYVNTVTELAQFSSWYYKNQLDNTTMLCPGKVFQKLWTKTIAVAVENFNKKDRLLGSTHYFAPKNMVPRYRVPAWAKGRHAIGFGGHIFLINKGTLDEDLQHKVVYLSKNIKKVTIEDDQIRRIR
jgi:spore germination cell wall hydrolase CwlJ-like protein